jgi:hypothetical protein
VGGDQGMKARKAGRFKPELDASSFTWLVASGLLVTGLVGEEFTQVSGLIHAGAAAQVTGPPPEAIGATVSPEHPRSERAA